MASLYSNVGTLNAQYGNVDNPKIPRLAEYGNILTNATEVAKQRGSGNYNPPPRWEQSTDRGYAWENAFPMYVKKTNDTTRSENNPKGFSPVAPEAINSDNMSFAHFNTPSQLGDDLRKRAYQVGSTGLHSQPVGSWNRPEFEGVGDQYTEWAIKSLQMTPNTLLNFFFNKENVDYLQKRTIQEVKKIRGEDIAPQSIDELLIIMRNKYIYALSGWLPQQSNSNFPHNRGPAACSLEERLTRLNKSVIEETVKQVFSGIDQYKQFIKDQSSLPMPLSHPVLTTMKGSRELSENIGFNSGHERTLAASSFSQRYNMGV